MMMMMMMMMIDYWTKIVRFITISLIPCCFLQVNSYSEEGSLWFDGNR